MKKHPVTKAGGPTATNVQALFSQALDYHYKGRFEEAIAVYDRIIAFDPHHGPAQANRSAALHSLGRPPKALTGYDHVTTTENVHELFRQAADHHRNGRFAGAIAAYERVIAARPDHAEAHANRALALSSFGRHDDALAGLDRAVALRPDFSEAHFFRGNALRRLQRFEEALSAYERVVALKPDHVNAHNNHGVAANALGRHAEALASYERALALDPECADTYCNLGNTLNALGRPSQALAAFERAIVRKPGDPDAHEGRAKALDRLGRLDEALASYERAMKIKPDDAEMHNERGRILQRLARYDDALASYDRAIAIEPGQAFAQFNRGLLLLLKGNYQCGLEAFEWRWRCVSSLRQRGFAQPQWRGEPIAGKTILLHVEQGAGDTMQMLRYLPLVKAKAGHVILELPKPAHALLGPLTQGMTVIEPGSPLPPFDVHCPEMSLPLAFATKVDTIPHSIPYLTVAAERRADWASRLPRSAKPRIGLAWSGNPDHANDHNRSIALELLAPLLDVNGFSFISLQRDYRDGDLPALARLPIERIDDALSDFGDTAAAIEQCDLVISVDTVVAHLAGSLGRKLWLLLPHVPDWRWLLEQTDSPWYPTARLFRQSTIGNWQSVIDDVRRELSAFRPDGNR